MTSAKPSIGEINPFSAEARSGNREKLFASEAERAAVADETRRLQEQGYVILEREIAGTTSKKCAAQLTLSIPRHD